MNKIEELKQKINEAKETNGDWNSPYQELMKAVYNNSVLFFALSKDKYNAETMKSVPLITTKDFGGIPALYIFSDVNTASAWMRHYRYFTEDMKYGLIGAVEKENSADFFSIFPIAKLIGARMIMLDEGGSYVGIELDAFLEANNIDSSKAECIITKDEADKLLSNEIAPKIKFAEMNAIPLTR